MDSMKPKNWKDLARAVSLGAAPAMDILRERGGDVRIARTSAMDGASVVVKLWNRPGLRGALRRMSRTNSARREWQTLCRLHRAGLFVPHPLAYVPALGPGAAHTEGMITRDLGPCQDATEHFKALISRGQAQREQAFVEQIVGATVIMVRLGLLDTDHRLPNFVVAPNGRPVRLDFELNVRRFWPGLWTNTYGLMLGTLLGSFVFAVQPDAARARAFAGRLRLALDPPRRVLRVAEVRMREMLARQEREIGLHMEVNNPWETTS